MPTIGASFGHSGHHLATITHHRGDIIGALFSCTLGVKSSEGFNVVVGWPVNPPPLLQTHLKRSSNALQTQLKRTSNAFQTHLKRTSNAPQTLKKLKKDNVEKVCLSMLIYLHIPPYTFMYLYIPPNSFIDLHIPPHTSKY